MARVALTATRSFSVKRRTTAQKQSALAFIKSIESSWKGHEAFAFWLIERLHPQTVVDLGFDRGLSTIVFAFQNKGNVFGIDWFDEGNYATKCFALDTAFRNISNALRFGYVKNIHLILGPFHEIARTWKRTIDVLQIDMAHTYESAKTHYENWGKYLSEDSVILVHDILSFPDETGRFFQELKLYKFIFPHSQGLGIASKNLELIEEIRQKFAAAS